MRASTVFTTDQTLLAAVRNVISTSDAVLACVAFVQERGLHLICNELQELRKRGCVARLLVTTTFGTTPDSALAFARELGVHVRKLNLGSGATFHPKLYLGRRRSRMRAVIGSANLTGGLASNIEIAVDLRGDAAARPLARTWEWAEGLWLHPCAREWTVPTPGKVPHEEFEPHLLALLVHALGRSSVVATLGRNPRPNRIIDINSTGVLVATERTSARGSGAELVPAWMFNLAFEYLRNRGRLSNVTLLNQLRVHRSSAVCAILARLPGVLVEPGPSIVLRWTASNSTAPDNEAFLEDGASLAAESRERAWNGAKTTRQRLAPP